MIGYLSGPYRALTAPFRRPMPTRKDPCLRAPAPARWRLLLLPSATATVGATVGERGDLAKTRANSMARGGCNLRHPGAECRAGSFLRAEPRALKRYKSATIGRESRRWLPTLRQSYSGRDSRTGWSVVPWRSIFQRQIPYEDDGCGRNSFRLSKRPRSGRLVGGRNGGGRGGSGLF